MPTLPAGALGDAHQQRSRREGPVTVFVDERLDDEPFDDDPVDDDRDREDRDEEDRSDDGPAIGTLDRLGADGVSC